MTNDFIKNPKLKNIDSTKLKIIMEIKEQGKHHSIEELLPQIMQINSELNNRGMNFTKAESALLIEALEEGMDASEKAKFNMIKGFINF